MPAAKSARAFSNLVRPRGRKVELELGPALRDGEHDARVALARARRDAHDRVHLPPAPFGPCVDKLPATHIVQQVVVGVRGDTGQ